MANSYIQLYEAQKQISEPQNAAREAISRLIAVRQSWTGVNNKRGYGFRGGLFRVFFDPETTQKNITALQAMLSADDIIQGILEHHNELSNGHSKALVEYLLLDLKSKPGEDLQQKLADLNTTIDSRPSITDEIAKNFYSNNKDRIKLYCSDVNQDSFLQNRYVIVNELQRLGWHEAQFIDRRTGQLNRERLNKVLVHQIKFIQPDYCYHGTPVENYDSIKAHGLDNQRGKRDKNNFFRIVTGPVTLTGSYQQAKSFSREGMVLRWPKRAEHPEEAEITLLGAASHKNPVPVELLEFSVDGRQWYSLQDARPEIHRHMFSVSPVIEQPRQPTSRSTPGI